MRIAALLVFLGGGRIIKKENDDDVATAESIIRAQEQAFGRDDARGAYSYAAPAIQEIFPAPDIFMSMVQNGYPPVYRHKSFDFRVSRSEGNWISQHVHIIDANG